MDLKNIDLNLLLVFNEVFVERRVSRAATNLGITQPAVSNALARLRRLLDDDLLVSTPKGMVPTPFADQLAEPVAYALGILHSAVQQRTTFDPVVSQRVFRIAITDIGEIYFLPQLMELLSQIAPGVSVATVRAGALDLKSEMETGQVDVAVGLLPVLQSGFFQRRLFEQRYVCMFRRGHRLDQGEISLDEFSEAGHVVVSATGTGHGKIDELIERSGVKRLVRLRVPHYVAVGHILGSTEMIATVPERFAERIAAPFGLSYVAHPVKLPSSAISMFWHAKVHKDPANQWIRGLFFNMHSDATVQRPRAG